MSAATRNLIGARLVGYVEGLLDFDSIDPSRRDRGRELVDQYYRAMHDDLRNVGQDNQSLSDFDSLVQGPVTKEMAV